MLGQREHRRVDKAEPEVGIFLIQLQDPGVAFLREIGDEKGSIHQTLIEDRLSSGSKTLPEEIVHLRDHGRWNDEPTYLFRDQPTAGGMPEIPTVVTGIQNARIEKDGH
jgi:hypothetical protein